MISANESERRNDTSQSMYELLTAYYIAVKCERKKNTHTHTMTALSQHFHMRFHTKWETFLFSSFFFRFLFSCFMHVWCYLVKIHGNILLLQATRCTKFYDLRLLNLSNSDDFYILYYIFFFAAKCGSAKKEKIANERGIQRQLTTVQCCRQHDKLVVIQLEDWIHISFVNETSFVGCFLLSFFLVQHSCHFQLVVRTHERR